jgi:iron(II)-dependent oxidoreductase
MTGPSQILLGLGLIAIGATLALAPGAVAGRAVEPGMVLIAAGPFKMGSRQQDGKVGIQVGVDELPQHEVALPAYLIDRTEVTAKQYKAFLNATERKPPGDPRFPEIYPWAAEGGVPKEFENHPVIYVTWSDAAAYCKWAGKRLPTEAEWEKAARGADGRIWPWGNTFDPKKANVRETDAAGTLPVGSFPDGASPYGVQDMAGNVAEWTADWYEAYPGSTLKRKAFGINKVVRGGAWTLFAEPYSRAAHRSIAQDPEKRHRSIGFRCAKDAK